MKLLDHHDLYNLIAWQDERMADNGAYDKALLHLQEELVKMNSGNREEGQRVVIVIEGRDAAGKGGVSSALPTTSIPMVPDRCPPGPERS